MLRWLNDVWKHSYGGVCTKSFWWRTSFWIIKTIFKMERDGSVIESHDFFLMHLEELIQHVCFHCRYCACFLIRYRNDLNELNWAHNFSCRTLMCIFVFTSSMFFVFFPKSHKSRWSKHGWSLRSLQLWYFGPEVVHMISWMFPIIYLKINKQTNHRPSF